MAKGQNFMFCVLTQRFLKIYRNDIYMSVQREKEKMEQKINYEKLRNDLKDYYGTAMFAGFGAAMMDVSKVDNASDEELLSIADKEGLNLSKYIK